MLRTNRKFVFYRFIDPHSKKEVMGDMPLHDWERIQRDFKRKDQFFKIREVDLDAPEVNRPTVIVRGASSTNEAPIQEDELECPLCGHVAKSATLLAKHRTKKHA